MGIDTDGVGAGEEVLLEGGQVGSSWEPARDTDDGDPVVGQAVVSRFGFEVAGGFDGGGLSPRGFDLSKAARAKYNLCDRKKFSHFRDFIAL